MDGTLDFGSNFRSFLNTIHNDTWNQFDDAPAVRSRTRRIPIDPLLLQVRRSVCVAGPDWTSLQVVKRTLADLVNATIPLESFQVRNPGDIKDGALLVPKLVLVAPHCAGRPVIDCQGEGGTLDAIYDEACEIGADVLLVYVNLPQAIYRPIRNMVYHPKMSEIVFPDQPVLRHLAEDNCLVTLVADQDFSAMQKNVMREWLEKPVGEAHPVYKAADYLSSLEYSMSDAEFWTDNENKRPHTDTEVTGFAESTEDHTIFDYKKYKKLKKVLRKKRQKEKTDYTKTPSDKMPLQYEHAIDDIELNTLQNNPMSSRQHRGYGSLQDHWSNPMNV